MKYNIEGRFAHGLPAGMKQCPLHPLTGQVMYAVDLDKRVCTACLAGAEPDPRLDAHPNTEIVEMALPSWGGCLTPDAAARVLGTSPAAVIDLDNEAKTARVRVRR